MKIVVLRANALLPAAIGASLMTLLMFVQVGCDKQNPPVESQHQPALDPDQVTEAEVKPEQQSSQATTTIQDSPPTKSAKQPVSISIQNFQDAAFKNDIETVRQAMLQGINVNAADSDLRTALMLASFEGHSDIVRLLVGNKAQLELRDSAGRTALLFAASGPNAKTVEFLLKSGASINVVDKAEGFSALMFAAAEGQAEVVHVLLRHQADKTLQDIDGDTARDFAEQNGHQKVVELLEKQ